MAFRKMNRNEILEFGNGSDLNLSDDLIDDIMNWMWTANDLLNWNKNLNFVLGRQQKKTM